MIQIAIDGPSGAGKSTVAKALAARLGIIYVDTGALYRTVGYYVRQKETDPKDPVAVEALLPEIRVDLGYRNGTQTVSLNGEDLGDSIRTPEMSMYASAVSAIPAVRTFLLQTQRSIAEKTGVIMDGRDIGTVVLPDAKVKIFLTASPEARAQRRYKELVEKGMDVKYEDILQDVITRDYNDSHREIAPLKPAEGSVTVDTTELDFEQSVDKIISVIKENR